ncbi:MULTISPECIES: hypothetical protein [Rhizobium]|uniref:hypothetical protein n=1 Tax=Rhizobium TaxID=379 RepID=UPI00036C1399|nr:MULTISPECIES: hypothetical protein [Rhizobium]MDI5929849.1 hypothetical protein [Rhizobium leguminosarum]NDK52101.1 hypothetical protein [Rhizobium laguerreae]TBC02072.1 hypothetical protein ELH34_36820 [Rhizobium ruizarguesonis]
MGEIRHFLQGDISNNGHLERIVAAAKADAGFWLMVKEREMERQTIGAEVDLEGDGEDAIDKSAPARLTPTITELADDLVSRMFGTCPPEVLVIIQQALLDAARVELSAVR